MLEASKNEAVLAVRLYNDPSQPRSLEGFIVHMHIAWIYLLQAKWMKAGKEKDFLFREPQNPRRYLRIDGEPKSQPLEWFVKQEFASTPAVRANINFFIRLRNRIEHRHVGDDAALQAVVSGECHALLLNFEEGIVALGGQSESLAHILHFPVFIGGFTDEGKSSLVKLTKRLPADLRTFLAEYDNSLDETVSKDPRYCLRLTVFLESGNRKGDLSMQFVNPQDLTSEELRVVESIARKGFVITKSKRINVSNLDNLKAETARKEVAKSIPFNFNAHDFTSAYKVGKFRPNHGAKNPEVTRADFVIYDEPHRDYTYTPAYVAYLIKNCSTAEGFKKTTGKPAARKPVASDSIE